MEEITVASTATTSATELDCRKRKADELAPEASSQPENASAAPKEHGGPTNTLATAAITTTSTNTTTETTTNMATTTSNNSATTIDNDSNNNSTKQSPYDSLRWKIVHNDDSDANLIKLVGLKTLFSKQLPKMPRAYIARLVFDRHHTSLALLSDHADLKDSDEEIIGGICYRSFPDMKFAEIAFCAVHSRHQVKGYGSKMMHLLKQHALSEGIEYLLTFADNYAIGYFRKQGFSKTISMPRGRYHGLIKEYDGGTPMECWLHPSVPYTNLSETIALQRQFILNRIRHTRAQSHKVLYPPLPYQSPADDTSRAHAAAARALRIPGVQPAGWTLADLLPASSLSSHDGPASSHTKLTSAQLKTELQSLVKRVQEQQFAWPFREPVNPKEVPDYLDVIVNPIDLKTMEKRIQAGYYKSKPMLFADLMLMVENCKTYNEEGSIFVECAENLERYVRSIFRE